MKIEKRNFIDQRDLQDFVLVHYGRFFHIGIDQNAEDDDVIKVHARLMGSIGDNRITKFVETGKHKFLADVLFSDMATRGLIEPGVYYVEISC